MDLLVAMPWLNVQEGGSGRRGSAGLWHGVKDVLCRSFRNDRVHVDVDGGRLGVTG